MQNASAIRSRPLVDLFHAVRDAIIVAHRRIEQRARLRRELDRLDVRQLRDMGVAREQIVQEAAKPFWRD